MNDFTGYSAVVTGGASGIGAATTQALAAAGARVTILDVQDGAGVAASLRGCRFTAVDVRDAGAVEQAVDAAAEAQGGLDGLVNNAGISPAKLLDGTAEDDWDRIIDINLKGAFNCVKAAVPHLRARGGGAIVNLSSVAGKNISLGAGVPYTTSKWGAIGFTRHLAYELAPWQIRANAICPGPTRTRLLGERGDTEESLAATAKGIPLGRVVEPGDIANAILFFLSPQAAMCTGAELVVDGGVVLGSAHAYEDYFRFRGGDAPVRSP